MLIRSGLIVLASFMIVGCSAPQLNQAELSSTRGDIASAVNEFVAEDPNLQTWFAESYGYAVFPEVGKGGIGIGGAYGTGLVYEQGTVIGTAALTQATIGLQLGGQSYQEVVFFQDRPALSRFTAGNFEFAAQASAVALTTGASADADFDNGMAVFTMENGGLMYEASIGGQKFDFRPIPSQPSNLAHGGTAPR